MASPRPDQWQQSLAAVGANNTSSPLQMAQLGTTDIGRHTNCSLSGVVYSSYQSQPLFVAWGRMRHSPNNVILTRRRNQLDGVAGLGSAVCSLSLLMAMVIFWRREAGVNLYYSSPA